MQALTDETFIAPASTSAAAAAAAARERKKCQSGSVLPFHSLPPGRAVSLCW